MKTPDQQLVATREAYEHRSWRMAYDGFKASDAVSPLSADDLWCLASASYLIGQEDDFVRALERGYEAFLSLPDPQSAVRCAFWLGIHRFGQGNTAQGSGWFGRAARALEGVEEACAEHGYLLLPVGYRHMASEDWGEAVQAATQAVQTAHRFGDLDLGALALHLKGYALIRLGRVEDGLACLDEAMVDVATGSVSPHVTGPVYCAVIGTCRMVQAVRRAQEWTVALEDWCEEQPEMVAYTGECRGYRAEILQRRGEWRAAIAEAQRASERYADELDVGAVGLALYQRGEAHRLLGEFEAAEDAYRAASRVGREPQPGLALLRLAQGQPEASVAAIRRALAETMDCFKRAELIPAYVDIMLEVGEVDEAKEACGELRQTSDLCAEGVIETVLARARGAIQLAEGDAEGALAPLRDALNGWQKLNAPYDAALTRLLLSRACRDLGDPDGAQLELDEARMILDRLGAPTRAFGGYHLGDPAIRSEKHGLTKREREVLELVATGVTNREVASTLFISEKTVARHLANIYGKLGISSRSAATAYAFQHNLLDPST